VALKTEHPEKYGWWLNELGSRVSPTKVNELNDINEISNLAENSK